MQRFHSTQTAVAGLSALLVVAALVPGRADDRQDDAQDDRKGRSYAIGMWGDVPYSALQATVGVPNLIADMNAQTPALRTVGRRAPCTASALT